MLGKSRQETLAQAAPTGSGSTGLPFRALPAIAGSLLGLTASAFLLVASFEPRVR